MLRSLDIDEREIRIEELELLRFICNNREYIINKLNGKKLDYTGLYPQIEVILSTKEHDVDYYGDVISIYELIKTNITIDISSEQLDDYSTNIDYLKYIYNKFGISYDKEDVLSCYYDKTINDYVYNDDLIEDYSGFGVIEIIIASTKLDKFISKYNKKTKEFNEFTFILNDFLDSFNTSQKIIDIRDKTNKFYNFMSTQSAYKFQICVICEVNDIPCLCKTLGETFDTLVKLDKFLDYNLVGELDE